MTAEEVRTLASSDGFRSTLSEASEGDLDKIMGALKKRLNTSEGIDTLMLSLDDVEKGVYGEEPPEYIIVTEELTRRHRGRAQKLLQVAQNRGVKTRTVPAGYRYAPRIVQLGGIVGMTDDKRTRE